jgi:hypothetical protein
MESKNFEGRDRILEFEADSTVVRAVRPSFHERREYQAIQLDAAFQAIAKCPTCDELWTQGPNIAARAVRVRRKTHWVVACLKQARQPAET